MTIHITPEPEYSYVSFESNIPLTSYLDVIQRVLNTFLPGKFILTIFANRVSIAFWFVGIVTMALVLYIYIHTLECKKNSIFYCHLLQTSMAADSHKELQKSITFGDWVRKDIQYSQFQNYELTYAHFVRFPAPFSWGLWRPGSSPGNRKIAIIMLVYWWRDATNTVFYLYYQIM